jgi:hypothetical protein
VRFITFETLVTASGISRTRPAMRSSPDPALDARIAAAFAGDATSIDVSRLLPEVAAAAKAADAATAEARARALDPLLSGDDLKLARAEMEGATFARDRLHEAAKKLVERIEGLKSLEADRRLQAEHERVSTERNRLAEEMNCMVKPILQIAHLVGEIEAVDREIGRLNATSALRHGHIAPVLIGSAQAVQVLFADALVRDGFAAVAKLTSKAA